MKYIWNSDIAEVVSFNIRKAKETESYFALTHNRPSKIKKFKWSSRKPNYNEMIIENDSGRMLKSEFLKIKVRYWEDEDPMFAIYWMMIDFEYALCQDIRENRFNYKRAVIFADKDEIYSLKLPEDYQLVNKKVRLPKKFVNDIVSYFKWAKNIEIFLYDEKDIKW